MWYCSVVSMNVRYVSSDLWSLLFHSYFHRCKKGGKDGNKATSCPLEVFTWNLLEEFSDMTLVEFADSDM